jgi:methylphosphotriester-DNA--protein-cysteine methyltransferase
VLLPLDAPETEIPDADARAVSTPEPEPQTETYVLNKNTKKFHRPGCRSVGEMAEKNKRVVESTREDVIASGYEPCKICKP